MPMQEIENVEQDSVSCATTIAALLFFAEKFPHRQFNSAELSIISGIGRTAMSQIKNASDTPFSLGKCTMQRLDSWLASHPGWKQCESRKQWSSRAVSEHAKNLAKEISKKK